MQVKDYYNFATFSNTASFNRIDGVKKVFTNIVEGVTKATKPIQEASETVVNLPSTLKTIQEANQHSKLGNRLNMLGLAAVPVGLAPLVVKDASTKSAEKMRAEDKLREAKGLPPLAVNAQAKALATADNTAGGATVAANSVNTGVDVANSPLPSTVSRKTRDGVVRVTNMADPRFVS